MQGLPQEGYKYTRACFRFLVNYRVDPPSSTQTLLPTWSMTPPLGCRSSLYHFSCTIYLLAGTGGIPWSVLRHFVFPFPTDRVLSSMLFPPLDTLIRFSLTSLLSASQSTVFPCSTMGM